MNDLISRQAAIDALKRKTFRLTFAEEQNCEGHVTWSAYAVYSDVMEGELLELPSAQPTVDAITVEYIHRRIETLNEYISKWGCSFEHEEMVNAYIHEVSALVRLVNDWRKEE